MNNFKHSVPVHIRLKISEIVESLELSDLFPKAEFLGCERKDEIEGNYVSGWMPNQNGGFEKSDFCRNDIDITYHSTKKQSEYMRESETHCIECFKQDYPDLIEESEEYYEELCNYESEWHDPALCRVQVFIEKENEGITLVQSINYKDAPYFREKRDEIIRLLNFEINEFESLTVDEIIQQFKDCPVQQ